MKRTIISILLCVLLLFSVCSVAHAEELLVVSAAPLPLIVDDAGLLSEEQKDALEKKAEEISERQGCNVIVYTTSDLGVYNATEFSDEKIKEYGSGNDNDSILLLIYYKGPGASENYMELNRMGYGIEAVTDYGMEHVFDVIESDMSQGRFDRAIQKYLETADDLLTQARNGEPYDVPKRKPNYVLIWIIALLLGFLFSLLPLASMKSKIQNVSKKTAAANYVRDGSMNLATNRDIFLYANTATRVINTGSSGGRPSGGSSGGSTTHISHSGSVHASGGRHF